MSAKTLADTNFEYSVPTWRYQQFYNTVMRVARQEAERKGFDHTRAPVVTERGTSTVLTWRWDGTLFTA